MKIIYSGGYDKLLLESESKNVIHRYRDLVNQLLSEQKKVVFVTNAKRVGYYDDKLKTVIGRAGFDIVDDNSENVNWESYDMLIILGGEQMKLKTALDNLKFDLSKLKTNTLLIGDSAGAMVMGAWFYDSVIDSNGDFQVTFHQGFNRVSNNIILVHANNPRYISSALISNVKDFAKAHALILISLEENQEYILDKNYIY